MGQADRRAFGAASDRSTEPACPNRRQARCLTPEQGVAPALLRWQVPVGLVDDRDVAPILSRRSTIHLPGHQVGEPVPGPWRPRSGDQRAAEPATWPPALAARNLSVILPGTAAHGAGGIGRWSSGARHQRPPTQPGGAAGGCSRESASDRSGCQRAGLAAAVRAGTGAHRGRKAHQPPLKRPQSGLAARRRCTAGGCRTRATVGGHAATGPASGKGAAGAPSGDPG